MASNSNNAEIRQLERTLGNLLNKQLQNICSQNGLRTSGVKAELQGRIKTALVQSNYADPARFRHIANSVMSTRGGTYTSPQSQTSDSNNGGLPNGFGSYRSPSQYSTASSMKGNSPLPYAQGGPLPTPSFGGYNNSNVSGGSHKAFGHNSHDLQFKPSPFYVIDSRIGDVKPCDVMSQHRNSVHISIKVNEYAALQRCTYDKSLRIMVFCAGDNQGLQDISFPHQSEIKVNSGDVKANLRGLKGKPGSTRPVDITDLLRLKQFNYANSVEFTYALTTKVKKRSKSQAQKYYLSVYLCKMVSVENLVAKIKQRKIPKAAVVQEMSKKASDPDIIATSTTLSLKCPLSYTRLRVPCRSTLCTHTQCFDATSYLQLQEQGPQWICPICNKSATFDSLAVDEYVKDILENTSESLEQVTIEPTGEWRKQTAEPEAPKPRKSGASTKIDDDDDISIVIESNGYGSGPSRSTNGAANALSTPNRSLLSGGTPSESSREPSTAPRPGNKRPAEVIDLTLSSDEDDEPIVRAPKRQYLGQGANGSELTLPAIPDYNY